MTSGPRAFEIRRMRADDVAGTARLHAEFFGEGDGHGHTIANLGVGFLEAAFYRANLDNPYLFVDLAWWGDRPVGFSVYASNRRRVFRETLRRHPLVVAGALSRLAVRRPLVVVEHVFRNLRFLTDRIPEEVRYVPGWYILLGVQPDYRTRAFRRRTGIHVALELWGHMERTLRDQGCNRFWAAPGAHNMAINRFFQRQGATLAATGKVQGMACNFYLKQLESFDRSRAREPDCVRP